MPRCVTEIDFDPLSLGGTAADVTDTDVRTGVEPTERTGLIWVSEGADEVIDLTGVPCCGACGADAVIGVTVVVRSRVVEVVVVVAWAGFAGLAPSTSCMAAVCAFEAAAALLAAALAGVSRGIDAVWADACDASNPLSAAPATIAASVPREPTRCMRTLRRNTVMSSLLA